MFVGHSDRAVPRFSAYELGGSQNRTISNCAPINLNRFLPAPDDYVDCRANRKVEARKEDLLKLGRMRFGPPTEFQETALRAITDPDRLVRILKVLLDVRNWDELLATK
jgi:hypothetical protein